MPVLIEISDVAIARASAAATRQGVNLFARQLDLSDHSMASALAKAEPPEPVTLVCCFHYLNRSLLQTVASDLPPGAVFAASIATVGNLERHDRPSARFLLDPGELGDLVVGMGQEDHGSQLTVLHHWEGWNSAGFHEAEIVVRRSRHLSNWAE